MGGNDGYLVGRDLCLYVCLAGPKPSLCTGFYVGQLGKLSTDTVPGVSCPWNVIIMCLSIKHVFAQYSFHGCVTFVQYVSQ